MIRKSGKAPRLLLTVAVASVVSAPQGAHADDNYACGQAHLIPNTFPYTGSVAWDDRDDWYLHPALLPVHVYTLAMTGGDADLYVYAGCDGGAGRDLLCYSNRSGTATDECTAVSVGPRNHFVQVVYYSGPTTRYRLTVSEVPRP